MPRNGQLTCDYEGLFVAIFQHYSTLIRLSTIFENQQKKSHDFYTNSNKDNFEFHPKKRTSGFKTNLMCPFSVKIAILGKCDFFCPQCI